MYLITYRCRGINACDMDDSFQLTVIVMIIVAGQDTNE